MQLTSLLPILLLPLSALASPFSPQGASPIAPRWDDGDDDGHDGYQHGHGNDNCLDNTDVNDIVQAYVKLISNYDDDTANEWLSDSFEDYSDSINILVGIPLGSRTFTKASFMAAQKQNPKFPLTLEGTPVVDCDAVTIIWHTVFGAGYSARGLSSIKTAYENGSWVISRLDVEFNSLAWMLNMGGGYTLNGKKVGNVAC